MNFHYKDPVHVNRRNNGISFSHLFPGGGGGGGASDNFLYVNCLCFCFYV